MVDAFTGFAILSGVILIGTAARYVIRKFANGEETVNKGSPEVARTPLEDLTQSSEDFFDRYKRLVELSRDALKMYFDLLVKPEHLKQRLHLNKENFNKARVFSETDFKKMYPKNKDPTSEEFDISLMYRILRNADGGLISEPNSGWGKDPKFEDQSYSDHIERVRIQRNWLEHITKKKMCKDEFIMRATELSLAILKLSHDKLMEEVLKDGYLWQNTKTTIAIEVQNKQEKSDMNIMCENVVDLLQSCIDLLSEISTPEEVQETLSYVENQLDNIKKEDLPFISNNATKRVNEWIKKHREAPNRLVLKSCLNLCKKCAVQYKGSITKASMGSIILSMRFTNRKGFMQFLEDCSNGTFVSSVISLLCSDPIFKRYQKKSTDVICHTEYVNEKESAKFHLKKTTAKLTQRKGVKDISNTTIESRAGLQCIYKFQAYLRPGRRSDPPGKVKELLSS